MDARTAEAIKAANPELHHRVRRRPSDRAARGDAQGLVRRSISPGGKEFDHSMVEVAQGMDWSKIGGISYRSNGAIHHNPDRPILTNEELDKLPFVTEVYENNLDYLKYNSPYCQYPYVSMYTGRGCPARCTFCLWPQVTQGHSYRVRSPENVYEEVVAMKAKFPKMKELFFDDDTFTADPMRARKIAQLLKPLGITWSTNSRANVDYETLKILKDGGLRLFVVGYESGNAQILKNIKKGVRLDRARRFTQDCHDLGILIHGTFILGLPGETKRDDPGIDALRARDGLRDHPGFARVALPGHRTLRLRDQERLPGGRSAARRVRLSEVHGEISGTDQRRDLRRGRALLSQLLLPPALHLQGGAQDGDFERGMQAAAQGRRAVSLHDAPAAASDCATTRRCRHRPRRKTEAEIIRGATMKLAALHLGHCGVLVSTIYYLAAIVAGLLFARRANSAPPPLPKIPPRVAMLKPLRGVSDHLRDNLVSFLEIAYPRVEFIFGVDSYEDRATEIPVRLRAPYQYANITRDRRRRARTAQIARSPS